MGFIGGNLLPDYLLHRLTPNIDACLTSNQPIYVLKSPALAYPSIR